MIITFYGVRGSIPSPGAHTVKYGGNTSCVHVDLSSGRKLILDAGTGIRALGKELADTDEPINILLSHGHWDHIQGFPFFNPIYQRDRHIRVYINDTKEHNKLCSLFEQIDGANFPVNANDLPSSSECIFDNIETSLASDDIQIHCAALNHPGGGSAYRIEDEGTSCAYITDNELQPPGKVATSYEKWVEFCQGVDVLIHDAQYLESDMPHKHGWGHSLVTQVRQLALDAEVGCLVMFHHDPDRADTEIDFIQKENDNFFRGQRAPSISLCAAERMQIRLAARKGKRAAIEVS
jgi:phosphoribosyl 1,2-cyclic phosphodiesterase